jgi:hypothetical protein
MEGFHRLAKSLRFLADSHEREAEQVMKRGMGELTKEHECAKRPPKTSLSS